MTMLEALSRKHAYGRLNAYPGHFRGAKDALGTVKSRYTRQFMILSVDETDYCLSYASKLFCQFQVQIEVDLVIILTILSRFRKKKEETPERTEI